MKAGEKSLKFLCNIDVLEVPFFQRPYVWKEDNWQELLHALLEGELQFLGSIIIKWQKNRNEAKKAILVDGQQRLTTISILIKALYDFMMEDANIKETRKLLINESARNALFYMVDSEKSEFASTIMHSCFDGKAFECVIGNVQDDLSISSNKEKILKTPKYKLTRIEECYKYFYTELKKVYNGASGCEKDKDVARKLWDFIFSEANTVLVVIEVDESEEEQKIFDTINSSGVKLTFADIIKNSIFQKLKELMKDDERLIKFYNVTWKTTFENDRDTIDYWGKGKKGVKGHAINQNIELFLLSYATIKEIFKLSEKESISKLPASYKTYLEEKIKTQDECKDFINEIIRYAEVYRNHFLEFSDDSVFNFKDSEKRLFKILESQKITSYHPYILYIYEKYENDDERRKTLLNMLEKFIVKVQIIKDDYYTKNPALFCEKFIKDIKMDMGTLVARECSKISNASVQESIKTNVKPNLGKMLLFWIELYRRYKDVARYGQANFDYNYQLEHIMPQEWSEHWKDIPYTNDNGEELVVSDDDASSSELYEKREAKVTSLGNMTILRAKLNNELKNYDFKRKVEGDGKKKGMKEYADLSITRKDIIEDIYEAGLSWNEYRIAKRAEELGTEIVEIWGN